MSKKPELDYMFHPESFALVGASDTYFNHGNIVIKEMQRGGYKGKIYPVNPEFTEILGLKCYPNIKEIPGDIDHVFVGIRAENTPELMKDCVEKKVKVCHFFASGFGELDTEEGRQLEDEVVEIAIKNNIRIIGPNSMGIYCPSSGLYFCSGIEHQGGQLGLLSQSGGNLIFLSRAAPMRGAAISKAVSYGNAADIDESDLFEYFADDHETRVIGAYVEGIKDGKRFQSALKKAAESKPTIIFKAGKTELGASTAVSHTGALAGSTDVWDGVISQAGAIQVDSLDELVDLSSLFLYMQPIEGRKVGIFGLGGGVNVMAADDICKANLTLPGLPEDIQEKLTEILPMAGSFYKNPIDSPVILRNNDALQKTMQILSGWNDIDVLLLHMPYEIIGWSMEQLKESGLSKIIGQRLADFAKKVDLPTAIVLHYVIREEALQLREEDISIFRDAGLPVFTSIESAAKALDKFIGYHERRAKKSEKS